MHLKTVNHIGEVGLDDRFVHLTVVPLEIMG